MTTPDQCRAWYKKNREKHIANVRARRIEYKKDKRTRSDAKEDSIINLDGWETRFKIGYAAGRRWHAKLFEKVREDFLQEIRIAALTTSEVKELFRCVDKRLRRLEREIL